MTTDPSLDEIADAAAAREELRDAARAVLAKAWSVEQTRALLGGEAPAFDDALWATIRSLGWADVLVSEAAGGGGATVAQLCVLAEEAGAVAAPVPLGAAAAAAWCEQRCVDGTPLVVLGTAAGFDGGTVSGSWPVVPYGAIATRLVVPTAAGVVVVDPAGPGVEVTPVRSLDHGPAAAIALSSAPAEVIPGTEWAAVERIATLASVAELVGVAAAANDAAAEYAKVRIAFDRPIGSFQAIKHRLVDQRAAIEVARALTTRAADACDRASTDADALTSLAAFWAIDSLRGVPESALQVFGGIGYTWEHDAHVHLRRAACLAAGLGSRGDHRARVATWLEGSH